MNRRRFIASTLTAAALPRLADARAPEATPVAPTWSVTDIREFTSGAEMVLLSPDGSRVLEANLYEPDEFCMHDFASGTRMCTTVDVARIRPNSVTWAPDSSAITLTTDRGSTMLDTDVLVFDVASTELRNLTDDGADGLAADKPGFPYDDFASWTRDSQHLVFQRIPTDGTNTSVMRISRDGGQPEEIASFSGSNTPIINAPFRQVADGSLLFSAGLLQDEDIDMGIFHIFPNGEMQSLTEGTAFAGKGLFSLVDANAAGSHILVLTSDPGAGASTECSLFEPDTGTIIPIPGQHVASPTFSPDGEHILMATGTPEAVSISISTLDGTMHELGTIPPLSPEPGLAAVPITPALVWSELNIALLHTHVNTVLLTLEPDAASGATPAASAITPRARSGKTAAAAPTES